MNEHSETDADLIGASRRGERAAFGKLVERCARMVAAISYAATRDRTLSEDIAQDTFVVAWCELDRLRDPSALRPWLCRIARNLAHKARRRRAHEAPVGDPIVGAVRTPFDDVSDAQVERVIAAALEHVRQPYRETLVLFYYEERSAKEVAAALGVSEDVVHKRVSRGREQLAAGLDALVEVHLVRRRSRRDLAACVLALLPFPTTLPTISKGSAMSKITVLGMATAIGVLATTAPRLDARPHAPAKKQPAASALLVTHPTAKSSPTLPAAAVPSCAMAAEHILAIAAEGFEDAFDALPARVNSSARNLEANCRADHWSADAIECVLEADEMAVISKCTPAKKPQPHAISGADLSCATVGNHVAELMLASLTGTGQDNVAGSVLVDPEELRAGAQAECTDKAWSEPKRRCYAAATLMKQIVMCNLTLDD